MKNNQCSLSQKQLKRENREFLRQTNPGIRSMVGRYHRLSQIKADVAETAQWIRYQHDLRKEPNNLELHMKVDNLLEGMLTDYERLIGRHYIRRITKAEAHE